MDRNILKRYGIGALKGLGQNFLVDRLAVKRFLLAANISSEDIVLEIGPGTGVLTEQLVQQAKKVIAVEKDQRMINILKETLKDKKNLEIIQGDILKLDLSLLKEKYKLIGNLPFYLTAPVIRKFLEAERRPTEMTLVVQKEVGQRITAHPPKMNLLAVSIQAYAFPKIISYIKKTSFWPKPKVDSAIIKIVPSVKPGLAEGFFKVVKAGFSQPRKQLINNLSKPLNLSRAEAKEWLEKNNIKPERRAETLNIEDWLNLTKTLK